MSTTAPLDGALLSIRGRLWRVFHLAGGKHYALHCLRRSPRFVSVTARCPGTIVEELDEPVTDLRGQDHVGKGILLHFGGDVPADVVKEIMCKELGLPDELKRIVFWECAIKNFGRLQTCPVVTIHGAAVCIQVPPIPPARHARCLSGKRGPQIAGLAEYIRNRCRARPDRDELREYFSLLAVRLVDRCGAQWVEARIPAKYRASVLGAELHGTALEERIAEFRDRLRPALATYESPPLEYADEIQKIVLDGRYMGPRNGMANCDRVRNRLRGKRVSPRLLEDALDYEALRRDAVFDPRLDDEGLRKAARLGVWDIWDHPRATDEQREILLGRIFGEDPVWLGARGHRLVEFMRPAWRLKVLERVGVDDAIEIILRGGSHERELERLFARFQNDAEGVYTVARMTRSPELVLRAAKTRALYRHPDGATAILDNKCAPEDAI